MSWLALIGVAMIFAAVIIASFIWTVPETIKVEAIITDNKVAGEVFSGEFGESESGKVLICYVPVEEAAKIKAAGDVVFKDNISNEKIKTRAVKIYNGIKGNPDTLREGPLLWRDKYVAFLCYPVSTNLETGTIVEADIDTGSSAKLISLIFRGLGEK